MSETELFDRALRASAADRVALFDRECAHDPALRQRLEKLLAADADGAVTALADASATAAFDEPAAASSPGQIVAGKYKLLERIGEGGMGEVWVADQLEPIKRRVALKLIKPGMDSRSVLGRFEAERQALAVMDHPNIAKVLDAGTTNDSRPYFVMELVKGTPITEFCDARKLTPKQRLELFVPVCQAIQHAHMKGIIHRDIKPSNVLVALHDETPVPKVIDFGVAKAIGQQLTEKTIYTGFGALIGTPAYMAPEQATFNQLDVDTRADVYALGVLLYELLAGSPPIDQGRLKKAALDELLRIVRDEEPERPSQRLSTSQSKASIAATRQTDPVKLSALMKGELDWIVMKALEKDRTRRYDTANGLAKDIQRYLSGDAVEACPPTWGYRIQKAYRRNRPAVWVGTAFSLLGIGAVAMGAVLTKQAVNAQRIAAIQRDAAEAARAAEAEQRVAAEEAQRRAQRDNEAAKAAGEEVRRNLYFAAMNLIPGVSKAEQHGRVMELLDQQRPKPGESDLRGFEWHYWNREYQGDRREIKLNRYRLPFELSGNGRFGAATRSTTTIPNLSQTDDTLDVIDLASGALVKSWPVPGHRSGNLRVSADGRRVALMCLQNEMRRARLIVLNSDNGKELLNYVGEFFPSHGNRFALSPDGKRVAAIEAGLTGTRTVLDPGRTFVAKIWDLDEPGRGSIAIPVQDLRQDVTCVTFNPDGSQLAIGFVDRTTRTGLFEKSEASRSPAGLLVLNLVTKKPGSFVDLDTRVMGLSFSRDGARLTAAASSPLRTVQWQIEADGRLREIRSTPIDVSGPQSNLFSLRLCLSPDGRSHAVFSTQSANVWLVDSETGQLQEVVKSPGKVRSAVFHADGRRMWTVNSRTLDSRSEIVLNEWDLFRERLVRTERMPPREGTDEPAPVTINSRDGERSARYWPETGKLSIRDRDGKENHTVRIAPAPKLTVRENGEIGSFFAFARIAFSPNGRHLIALPSNGPAKVFDVLNGTEKVSVSGFTGFGLRQLNKQVEMSPRGDLLALPDPKGFKIVKADDLTERAFIPTDANQVFFSPDCRRLVTVSRLIIPGDTKTTPKMTLWDLESRREILSVPIGPESVIFSENGRRFAVEDSRSTSIWDAETGSKICDLGRGLDMRTGLFNPDATSFLNIDANAASTESLPAVWDATTGSLRFRLDGLTGTVVAVNFSPDGKRIVTATRNGLDVKLWDATTGRELLSLAGIEVGRNAGVYNLFFSDDGYQLTLKNGQGAEVVWDVTPRAGNRTP